MRLVALAASFLPLVCAHAATARAQTSTTSKLRLEVIGSDSASFDVTSTLVIGPTEVLAWDAQYHLADARRLADRIAATGKRLKAIVISHPDHDHYAGAAVLVERFPGTPVYMTAKALEWYNKTAVRDFQNEKSRRPELLADSLVTPQALPSPHLTVDGEAVEVIPDLPGDVIAPTNSLLWIPSLNAVLAADMAFNGVHPWLGSSNEASRVAWRAAVNRMAERRPAIVVAGHKKDASAADTPGVLTSMDAYLRDFEALRATSPNADVLQAAMLQKYPDFAVRVLLAFSSRAAFRPTGP